MQARKAQKEEFEQVKALMISILELQILERTIERDGGVQVHIYVMSRRTHTCHLLSKKPSPSRLLRCRLVVFSCGRHCEERRHIDDIRIRLGAPSSLSLQGEVISIKTACLARHIHSVELFVHRECRS